MRAMLLIAKLDRLARNVSFIFALRDSGVEFQCHDIPEANTLTIGLFAVLAQHERELISKRTRDALQAKKAQGFKLGSPQGFVGDVQKQGIPARKKRAAEHLTNRQLAEFVRLYRAQQYSFEAIAQKLNASGHRTRQGQAFAPMTVWRLARLNAEPVMPLGAAAANDHRASLAAGGEQQQIRARENTRPRRHRALLFVRLSDEEAAGLGIRVDVHVPR